MQEKYVQVLPSSWDGRFPFTNDSDEDFVFVWAKKGYLFPAHKTVDMMKMAFNATPLEVQQIRKFAAKKWAEREFFKSSKYESLRAREGTKDENGVIQPRLGSFNSAGVYSDDVLKDDIQRCLTPLPEVSAMVMEKEIERDTMSELHQENGEFVNKVIDEKKTTTLAPGEILLN
jgi:hypothetical protein